MSRLPTFLRRRRADVPPGLLPTADAIAAAREQATSPAPIDSRQQELQQQRDRLTERFALLQSDLGGAFYEMAIRDHVRLDVLTTKAAELQRVDAELAAVEASLAGGRGAPVGHCRNCGTGYDAQASFCAACGTAVVTVPLPESLTEHHVNGTAPQ